MGLNQDYKDIVERNKLFVRATFPVRLKQFYESYKKELDKKIINSVFDIHNVDEVGLFLKETHVELVKEKIYTSNGYIDPVVFDWISINNEVLEIDVDELETSTNFLWKKPYSLEMDLDSMTPLGYSTFMRNLRYTIHLLVLKNYSGKLRNKINIEPQLISFNDKIFKDAPSEQFFIALFENWLIQKGTPLVTIHYVYRRMSKKTPANKDLTISKLPDYTIECNQTKFAQYWNDTHQQNHPDKIGFSFKENGTTSIKTFEEISAISKDTFHTRLNAVLSRFQHQGVKYPQTP